MKIKLTFLFFILFNSYYLHGQSEFNYNLKKTPDLKITEKQADSILFKTNLTESEIVKKAFNFSRIFYKQNKLQLAIKYAKIQNNLSSINDTILLGIVGCYVYVEK